MSEPQGFYFHDREAPILSNCEKCGGGAYLASEKGYVREDNNLWVSVTCRECQHKMTESNLPNRAAYTEDLVWGLAEKVISKWNKEPFKFPLRRFTR